jgi:hypothetical protein
MDLIALLDQVRDETLPPLREEAGLDGDWPETDEQMVRYAELLESAVVGANVAVRLANEARKS